MPKKQITRAVDLLNAYKQICEILNEICIDEVPKLLEECYEARYRENDLDVDISESEEEEEEISDTEIDYYSDNSENSEED